jgi:hypothetical protein
MHNKSLKKQRLGICACALALFLSGCSASSCDIGVYLADDIQNAYGYCPSIEVDVVGLTEAEEKRFLAYDVDRYFAPPAQFRRSLGAVTLKFAENDMTARTIPDDAACWELWEQKGAKYIGVISNLPFISDSGEGITDPRKLIINMNDGFLVDSSEHYIEIGGSGIIEMKKAPDQGRDPEEVR